MAAKTPKYAWMNGEIVPWEEARVHVRSDSFMYGSNVFEGTRGYASEDGGQLYLFKNAEHLDRLFNSSMKILRMRVKWTPEDLTRAQIELLRANEFHADVHIRPTVYFGVGESHTGFDPSRIEIGAAITAVEMAPRPNLWDGMKVCVSSWRRIDDDSIPPRVKAGSNYLNTRYVLVEATLDGYDSAIVLNRQGKVSESPVACVMIVRDGKVVTPPVTAGILESITRSTIMDLFRTEMGIEVVEREIDRTELYIADEVFFCGTALQVQPVVSVDKYPVGTGQTGPMVREMQKLYFDIARGKNPKYASWLTPVY